MSKIKYYYDTETCKYEPVETKTIDIILPILGFLTSVIIISFILTFFHIIKSPSEYVLRTENQVLEDKYAGLEKDIKKLDLMLGVLKDRDARIYRVITEADSLPSYGLVIRGIRPSAELEKISISKRAIQLISAKMKTVEKLKQKMILRTKSYDNIIEKLKENTEMLSSIPSIRPCDKYNRVASGFGVRTHPILKVRKFHKGIDFAADRGTPIYSTGDGVIKKAKKNLGGYGNEIVIDHGYGYKTRYAHMQQFIVKRGQKVKKGQIIGYVGSTGSSTVSHLHYEILKDNKNINPVHFFFEDLTPKEYEEMFKQASEENQSLS